jgi:hypothetical protein
MKKTHLLCCLQLAILVGIVRLHGQHALDSRAMVVGDVTVFTVDNYTSGPIQWQVKHALLGKWEDIAGANAPSLRISPTGVQYPEQYVRAVLSSGHQGKTYFTAAVRLDISDDPANLKAGDNYAEGRVLLVQGDFLYIAKAQALEEERQPCLGNCTASWLYDQWQPQNAMRLMDEFDAWYDHPMTIANQDALLQMQNNYTCCAHCQNHVLRQPLTERVTSLHPISLKDPEQAGQILVSFPDTSNSTVQIMFDGMTSPDDQLVWNFQGGEVLSVDSSNIYLVGYDFGGFIKVKLNQYTAAGDTMVYESESFRPLLFSKHPIQLPIFFEGAITTADIDLDGFEDFLLTGGDTTQLYRNLQGVNFEPAPTPFPNLRYSISSFGDYNNDGYPDLLLAGYNKKDSMYVTKLYKNANGAAWEEQPLDVPGLTNGFCEWTDIDRDGLLDFIVSGATADSMAYTGLYKGDGAGGFVQMQTPIEQLAYSCGAFGDFNNDNFPDLVICGSRDSVRYAKLYKNVQGAFVAMPINMVPINNGSVAWADFNNDGLLDFSISGQKSEVEITTTQSGSPLYNNFNSRSATRYLNFGNETFGANDGTAIMNSAQRTADFNNDGKEDIMIAGQSGLQSAIIGIGGPATDIPPHIFRMSVIFLFNNITNNNSLGFVNARANLPNVLAQNLNTHLIPTQHQFRTLALFDFNRDGRTDIIRSGAHIEHPSAIYANRTYRSNTPPTAPSNLIAEIIACDSIYLQWDHAEDDLTPARTLVYDLYIGTTPGAGDVLSISNDDQLQNNWFRLHKSLEKGTYYWSVRARDGARIFGDWASEGSFVIGVPTPTITFDGTQLVSSAAEGNQWYNTSGPIPGANDSTYTPIANERYFSVVTDVNGCVSDTSNIIEIILTGTKETKAIGFSLYPNPTSGAFTLQGISDIQEVQIYSLSGHLLLTQPYAYERDFYIGELAKGIYFIRIITPEVHYTGRLLKH